MGRKQKLKGRKRQHLLTSTELCKHFKISRKTLYNWRKKGFPVEVAFQGKMLYSLRRVKTWMRDYGKETPLES